MAERERAAAAARAEEREAQKAAKRQQRIDAWNELLAYTQPALAAAARQPDGWVMVHFQRQTLLGGFKPDPKAGWEVTTYRYDHKGASCASTVYLLSDGRLAIHDMGGPKVLEGMFLETLIEARGHLGWYAFPFESVKLALQELAAGNAHSRPIPPTSSAPSA